MIVLSSKWLNKGVQLHQVPELTSMIAIFNKTATTAKAHGLSKVAPFICLGCGAKRNVRYPNGGSWINTNEWDYEVKHCASSHLVYKNDRFSKTGSGRTWGKHSKKSDRFLAKGELQLSARCAAQ